MRHLLNILFFALISLPAMAGTGSGNISEIVNTSIPSNSTTAGGGSVLPLGDITSGTVYQIYAAGNTTSNFYPFYKNGVLFSVATGHKAYCISGTAYGSSASTVYQLVSATATFSGASTTVLTGGVYQCGAAGNNCQITSSTAATSGPMPGPYMFDGTSATVWPGFNNTGGGNIAIFLSMTCTTI